MSRLPDGSSASGAQASPEEAQEIAAALRTGAVPRQGLHHLATGLDRLEAAVAEELAYVAQGEGRGLAKWVRGEYGSGKTFATRLLCARARQLGFATAEVQISANDTPLHHLETVYRRLIERLTTAAHGGGAFKAVVESWLFEVGEEVTRLRGIGEDDPSFSAAVSERLEAKLSSLGERSTAFSQVLRAYQTVVEAGEFAVGQGLLAWLAGQPQVDRAITVRAGVKGAVDGQAALTFLRGLLVLLRQSGYAGLVLVLDEAETVQRMPGPAREKSLNALRQLVDMLLGGELPGLYMLVTGTPEFYEGYKGLRALQPLYQRVATRFEADARFDNLRAPQVRLPPFDEARLLEVGRRVRDLFPSRNAERVARTASDGLLEAMVAKVVGAFGGKVSVCPRIFLREVVDVLDRIDQHPDYDPGASYEVQVDEAALRPQELAARRGQAAPGEGAGEEEDGEPGAAPPRLDG